MTTNYDIKKFAKNFKAYNKTINDKRVLKLVTQTLNGYIFVTDNNEELTVLDENMLSLNEKNIALKLAKSKRNTYNQKLNEKFNKWKQLVTEFENLLDIHDKEYQLTKEQHKKLDLINLKLIYILIDLKVNLGMPLNDISINDIIYYCNSIAFDVYNNQYEPLSIEKHIDEQKINIINLKQI